LISKKGSTVKVHYKGTLNDGTMFDSSEGGEPLEFTLGTGSMIAGFEKAAYGMQEGDSKKVTIPAAEAYGFHDEDMVLEIDRTDLPPGLDPKIGDQLRMKDREGVSRVVEVTATSKESITIDANHPLAGKDLTFEIKMVEVKG